MHIQLEERGAYLNTYLGSPSPLGLLLSSHLRRAFIYIRTAHHGFPRFPVASILP
jgi:hypothetical protein